MSARVDTEVFVSRKKNPHTSKSKTTATTTTTTVNELTTKQKNVADTKSILGDVDSLTNVAEPTHTERTRNTPPPVAVEVTVATTTAKTCVSPLQQQQNVLVDSTRVKRRKLEQTKSSTSNGTLRKKATPKRTLPPQIEALYRQLNDNIRSTSLVQKEEQEAARQLADAQRRLKAAAQHATELAKQKEVLEKQLYNAELELDNEFTQQYRHLVSFQKEFGHTNVHLSKLPAHTALAAWAKKMRRIRQLHQAGDQYQGPEWKFHLQALEHIGFAWDAIKDQWKIQFDKMLAFKAENGHCCVPKSYKPNKSLGAWVHRQRYFYKLYHEGKPTQLTPERIELLNSVGFSWSGDSTTPVDASTMPRPTKPRRGQGKKTPDEEWEHYFQLLVAFKAQHGHVKISAVDDKSRNNQLRDWTAWQRREYKRWKEGLQSHVTEAHVRRLSEIGFSWEVWPNKQTSNSTDTKVGAISDSPGNADKKVEPSLQGL